MSGSIARVVFCLAIVAVAQPSAFRGTTTGGQYGPGVIEINPDYDGDSDFLTQVMLHEMGHAIGFTDVSTSGCDAQTIMWFSISPSGSHMTSIGSADTCKLSGELDRINRERLRPPCGYSCQEGSGADSPIIINFENGGYRLTGIEAPVCFDIAATGHATCTGWTAAGAQEAFLALDRDGDGTISSGAELFGNATMLKNGQRAPNGFAALAELDDNGDGVIDHDDAIWPALMLWTDLNHDGVSQPAELRPVSGSSITAIGLDYHWSGRRDVSGNTFRYQSQVWMTNGTGHIMTRPVYDIFFSRE